MKKCIASIAAASLLLVGCANNKTISAKMNEEVETMFYSFEVDKAVSTSNINGHVPAEGMNYVVVTVTVKNTYEDPFDMTDTHFQLQWTTASDSEVPESTAEAVGNVSSDTVNYALPITQVTDEVFTEDELPKQYTLEVGETKTGLLIFEVPVTESVFNFCSADYYSYRIDDEVMTGNTFFVSIVPSQVAE